MLNTITPQTLTWHDAIVNPPKLPGFYLVAHRKDWDTTYKVTTMAYVNFGTHVNKVLHWNKGPHWYSGRVEWWMPLPEAPKGVM